MVIMINIPLRMRKMFSCENGEVGVVVTFEAAEGPYELNALAMAELIPITISKYPPMINPIIMKATKLKTAPFINPSFIFGFPRIPVVMPPKNSAAKSIKE